MAIIFLGIELVNTASGPAIGIRIMVDSEEIDIDLSPSIELPEMKCDGWKESFLTGDRRNSIVKNVRKANIHAVPKESMFWRKSYSQKIKVLLTTMDTNGECRKHCHKILKYDFKKWENTNGRAKGISTFIFVVSV